MDIPLLGYPQKTPSLEGNHMKGASAVIFRLKNIPNGLSIIRILIAVVFPFLTAEWRLYLFGIALATEYLDGIIARKFGWVTPLGVFLDPLADRIFALAVSLTLISLHRLGWADFSLLFFRDFVVSIGFIYLVFIRGRKDRVQDFVPNFLGKMTTAFQYIVFFESLAAAKASPWILFVTQSTSLAAGLWYFLHFRENKIKQNGHSKPL